MSYTDRLNRFEMEIKIQDGVGELLIHGVIQISDGITDLIIIGDGIADSIITGVGEIHLTTLGLDLILVILLFLL
ncbi:MAG: hypothetical protein IPO64_11890 [Bacteroidetes bacterium]|nr:hypothetical protein [Bacteroidota bacterium]